MDDPVPTGSMTNRLRRHLRRWGPYWIAGAGLLAASEMLWLWQTWPVRDLLRITTGAGT